LFREVSAAQPNRLMGEQAHEMAQRIAQSLWMGYQMSQRPEAIPSALNHD
jgi:hemoglobin